MRLTKERAPENGEKVLVHEFTVEFTAVLVNDYAFSWTENQTSQWADTAEQQTKWVGHRLEQRQIPRFGLVVDDSWYPAERIAKISWTVA